MEKRYLISSNPAYSTLNLFLKIIIYRYVFTISNLDAEAPCFEYFYEELVRIMSCSYSIQQLDISQIPQYFCYERAKELVLFKIERKWSNIAYSLYPDVIFKN